MSAGVVCCWSAAVAIHLVKLSRDLISLEVEAVAVEVLDESRPNFEEACLKDMLNAIEDEGEQ